MSGNIKEVKVRGEHVSIMMVLDLMDGKMWPKQGQKVDTSSEFHEMYSQNLKFDNLNDDKILAKFYHISTKSFQFLNQMKQCYVV